ncbi:MAG: Ig-like domain-containing protein, partial [Hyphomicrobiaceae bacterium]
DGSWSFDPGTAYNGLDAGETAVETIVYTASDGNGGTATATLAVTIQGANDAPVVIDPANPGTSESPIPATDPSAVLPAVTATDGQVLSPIDVGAVVVDPDGEPLVFALGPDAPAWLAIDPATGVVTGTLPAGASQSGPYVVTVTATDPDGTVATTQLTIAAVNLEPVALDDAATASEDGPAASGDVLANDADTGPDADALVVTGATQGGNALVLGQPFTTAGGGVLTLAADGSWSFDPGTAYNGLDAGETAVETIVYTVSDGNGGTATATLVVTIAGANDAPVVIDSANPGTAENPIPAGDPLHVIPGVTATDGQVLSPIDVGAVVVDPDGEPLIFGLGPDAPAWLAIDPATGVVTGTLPAGASQSGPYVVTVTATDPDGTVATTQLTIAAVNLEPVASDDAATASEDGPAASGDVLANDADTGPDADALVVTGATQGGNALVLGQPFTTAGGGLLTLGADGSWSFDPGTAYNGLDAGETAVETIVYTVSDGNGGTATATLVVTIAGANDAPVVIDPANPGTSENPNPATDPSAVLPSVTVRDGDVIDPIDVRPCFVDADGDPVKFSASGLPSGLTIDPATGVITGRIASDASVGGTYTVVVRATDPDGAFAETMVAIVVGNQEPVALDDSAASDRGQPVTITVLANDRDGGQDRDPLVVVAASAGHGSVVVEADGAITYRPNEGFEGVDTIVYVVSDGNGGTATAHVTVTVTAEAQARLLSASDWQPPAAPRGSESLTAEGAVLDALEPSGVGGPSDGLVAEGIVLDAVHRIHVSDGGRWSGSALSGGLGLAPYDVAGLSSFSLRIDTHDGQAVRVEAFVRGQTLIAALALEAGGGRADGIGWSVVQIDGRPLPAWLRFIDGSTLSGDRPADVEHIDLRVIGVLPDGTSVTNEIRLNTRSGQIDPLSIGRSGLLLPPPFGLQIRAEGAVGEASLAGLARMLDAAE